MNIFISWSGNRSRAIAEAFRDWLPKVLQASKPWMSSTDIDKGAKWDAEISTQLSTTNFGLICLTPENRFSPAMHFEAGALTKYIEEARLWTYLFDLEHADIKWPLSEFQHTKATESDIRKLLGSMNAALGEQKLLDNDLIEIYETWWPKLESRLSKVPIINDPSNKRTERDLVEEVLELSRMMSQSISRIQPYEQPTVSEIKGLAHSLWRVIHRCEELGITESLIRPLRGLQMSIQHVTNKFNLSSRDAKDIYGTLNRALLVLHPKIRKTRQSEQNSNLGNDQ